MERQEASGVATVNAMVTGRFLLNGAGFGTAAACGPCLCDPTS